MRKFFAIVLVFLFSALYLPFGLLGGVYLSFQDEKIDTSAARESYNNFLTESIWSFFAGMDVEGVEKRDVRMIVDKQISVESFEQNFSKLSADILDSPLENGIRINFEDFFSAGKEGFYEEMGALFFDKLPKCTESNQVAPDYNCVPKQMKKVDFTAVLRSDIERKVFSSLINNFDVKMSSSSSIHSLRDIFTDVLPMVLEIYLAILVFLLGVIALLIASPWVRVFKWQSLTLFFANFTLIFLAVFIYWLPAIVGTSLRNQGPSDTNSLFILMENIFSLLFQTVSKEILHISFPILILVLFSWIMLILWHRRIKNEYYVN